MFRVNSCKNRLTVFADKTTIHGFQELCSSQPVFWKIFWSLIIVSTLGISTYQIIKLAQEMFEEPTKTVMKPLSSPIEYPPMRFFYVSWVYWVDWKKAFRLGFEKSTLLYGLAYLVNITSEQSYNVTETSNKFQNVMRVNNFTTAMEFLDAVSFDSPPGFQFHNDILFKWAKCINYLRLFGYEATGDMIGTALVNVTRNRIGFTYNKSYSKPNTEFLSLEEINKNIRSGIFQFEVLHDEINQHVNLANFTAPPLMSFDNVEENEIAPTDHIWQSQVTVTSSLFHWYNTSAHQCNSEPSIIMQYNNCKYYCFSKLLREQNPKACFILRDAVRYGDDRIEMVCRHYTNFLMPSTIEQENNTLKDYGDIWYSASYKDCINVYCKKPCVEWKHTVSVVSINVPDELRNVKFKQNVFVLYPDNSVLEFWQLPSETWLSIIGNIGGIVGLWLGASIISVLQMIYLLCFSKNDSNTVKETKTIGEIKSPS